MKTVGKRRVLLLPVVILSFAGFIACNNNKNDQPGLTQQDQTFVSKATAANSQEIQFGQLAAQRSKNDSVLAFARMMVNDHTAAKTSLDSIAKSLSVVTSDTMDTAHKTLYNKMSNMSNYSFDSAYVMSQISDHKASQPLMQTEVGSGKNNLLINYANKNLPIITRHLARANSLQLYLLQTQVPH